MPCASSGCAGSACGRWRGGSVASSFPAPISPRCATPSGALRAQQKTYKALLEALPGWSVRARLGTLWQPVAIISTSHDYLPLARRVEQFASLPNATIHPGWSPRLAGGRSRRVQSSVAADPLNPIGGADSRGR